MQLADDTKLVFQYPASDGEAATTWGEFKTVNSDDPDMLRDVEYQIAKNNYAEIGGGAMPITWIFA